MDLILLFFLVVCALAAVFMKDLLSATVILVAYSLIMSLVWMRLNAVDVAFTEASVGAGITTVLIIATLSRTKRMEEDAGGRAARGRRKGHFIMRLVPIVVVVAIAGALVYGTMDMPDFGDPGAPAHQHGADRYIKEGHHETASENVVTAVLANYRGYDTLGETTVIFTAGMGVLLLLRRRRR